MSLFQPDGTFRAYFELTPQQLAQQGVKLLILDIDNTLAPYERPLPNAQNKEWLDSFAAFGIQTVFLSNNHGKRVKHFNSELQLPCRNSAHKPLPFRAKAMMKAMGANKTNTVFLGDQIFTDMLCAHLAGAKGYLVPPIKDKTDCFTKFKRRLEKGFLRRYYKKHPQAPDVRLGTLVREENL